jgi:hypothetical protein
MVCVNDAGVTLAGNIRKEEGQQASLKQERKPGICEENVSKKRGVRWKECNRERERGKCGKINIQRWGKRGITEGTGG